MGYVHEWSTPNQRPLGTQSFDSWCGDVWLILNKLPAHSLNAGGYYADDPLLVCRDADHQSELPRVAFNGDGLVTFNGKGRNEYEWLGQGDFWFKRDEPHGFCKTNRKPYDLAVCAALLRLVHHCPCVGIGSDGEPDDWEIARRFVEDLFGQECPLPVGIHFYGPDADERMRAYKQAPSLALEGLLHG